jgi:hypothetical protein
MLGRFSNAALYKYPRMSSEDVKIWQPFLSDQGAKYDRFDYDLKVGTGVLPDLPVPEIFLQDFQELTKKRIDAVGYNKNGATLFEVKPRAGTSALGQLLTYKILFTQSYPDVPIYQLVLVCGLATDEEIQLYKQYGIIVEVYS